MWMFWIKNLLRCGWKGIFRQQPIQVHGQSKNNTLMPIRLFLYKTRILPLLVVCAIKSRVLKMKRYNLSFVEGLLSLVGLLLVLINLNLYFVDVLVAAKIIDFITMWVTRWNIRDETLKIIYSFSVIKLKLIILEIKF